MADSGRLGAWLSRHKGFSAGWCLHFIANDLLAARTKAQRRELAEALKRLVTPVLNLEIPPKNKRGRKDRFRTWHDAALVNALVKYRGAEERHAVKAVVLMRALELDQLPPGGWALKAHARIERYLRKKGGRLNCSHSPRELECAAIHLPKGIHRIK